MPLYLLDTDSASLFQRGEVAVRARVVATPPSDLGLTIITAEEQLRGRLSRIRRAQTGPERVAAYAHLRRTVVFLVNLRLYDFDARAEEQFQTLRRAHRHTGVHDLRIAAIALVNRAVLVTCNRRDFEAIADLTIEDWSAAT